MGLTEGVGRELVGSGFPDDSGCERRPDRTLITGEAWDCYQLQSLLPLKETYRETTKFGFLLRHYWMPATVLTFRRSSRTTFPDGRTSWAEQRIERSMARCRSNECLWREKVFRAGSNAGNGDDSPPVALDEMLCSYDRYEQTFYSAKPIEFGPLLPEQMMEARRGAIYRLPMIVPPGPVPLGFRWYATVGGDYMNYRLESEEQPGETSVLVIRREGRYTMWLGDCPGFGPTKVGLSPVPKGGEAKPAAVVIERKGVTLFASNRSVVLEDRIMDCVVEANGSFALCVGATEQIVTRLVRSCPTEAASAQRTTPAESHCCP